jgi:putative inorganic carbon (HCO3(-)) transporter
MSVAHEPATNKLSKTSAGESSLGSACHAAAWRRSGRWITRHELWLLAIAAPFLLFPNRWTPLAFGLIMLTWLGRWLALGRLTRRTPMDIPVLFLVVMATGAYLISAAPELSRAKFWGIILQVAVFYGVLNALNDERAVFRLARLMLLGTVVLALVTLVGTDWDSVRLLDLPQLYDRIPQLIRGLPGSGVAPNQELFHPREVGATMAMLLPLSVVWLFIGRGKMDRLLAAIALLSGALILLLSQAAMGLFGLAIALLLMALWWRRWLLWPAAAGFVVLVGLLIANLASLASIVLDMGDPLGIGFLLRFDMWSRALAMIHDLPFTGIGLNTFPLVQSHFYTGFLLGPEVHAHNLFLQTAVDLGLPGLLAFLGLLASFALTVIHAYRSTKSRQLRALLIGLAAGVLAYVAGGILDTMTLGAKPVLGLWAMFGLAAAVGFLTPDTAPSAGGKWTALRSRWLLVVPAALLLVALAAFPSARRRNFALIPAHRLIYEARTRGDFLADRGEAIALALERAIESNPDDPELQGMLGSLYGWQGANEAALDAFRRRVVLDGRKPLELYAPFEVWRLRLADEPIPDPWDSVSGVYRRWSGRFPERAEGHVLRALVLQEHRMETTKAENQLQLGLEQGARPPGLLNHYLNALSGSQ